ncbi:formimidoylglutamase [Flavobacteriales bacterium]|jgi:formiminoglutamase|nr:formimidoylglutamase [Flavobacteriales bacterium]
MSLGIYLNPLDENLSISKNWNRNTVGETITHYNDEVKLFEFDIAIIGVMEQRGNVGNDGCGSAPNRIREKFYELYNRFDSKANIIDLGNVLAGNTYKDTYFALTAVITELVKKEVIPVIIGGSHDLTYANYQAYENLEQVVNLVNIDRSIDLGLIEEEITEENFINHIIMHQPNYLFNFSSVGYQSYFVNKDIEAIVERMHFDAYRLGSVRADIEEMEPIVRNADILSFDVNAIKGSDFSGYAKPNPNGFLSDEICRISRYAGLSDKLSSFGLYSYNPVHDSTGNGAMLLAQMIWYFVEGFKERKGDYPVASKSKYKKYHVAMETEEHELIFYKSDFSGRWWMEVPFPSDLKSKFIRHQMVPCSYADYELALSGEVPDRWFQTFEKLA